jgi:tetratricopeptide (TPR) repeat protein
MRNAIAVLQFLSLTTMAMAAEDGIYEQYMGKAVTTLKANDVDTSMNLLRVAINCYWYEEHSKVDVNQVLNVDTKGMTKRQSAGMMVIKAVDLMRQRKVVSAITLLEEALRTDSSLPEVHNTLGVCREIRGDSEKAIRDYTAALNLNPRYHDALENRRNAYRRANQIKLALKDQLALQVLLNPVSPNPRIEADAATPGEGDASEIE